MLLDTGAQLGHSLPAAEGVFDLYDDDGKTLSYEQGACSWLRLRAEQSAEGELIGTTEPISGPDVTTYGAISWRPMSQSV